jgi:hypothetical protein
VIETVIFLITSRYCRRYITPSDVAEIFGMSRIGVMK